MNKLCFLSSKETWLLLLMINFYYENMMAAEYSIWICYFINTQSHFILQSFYLSSQNVLTVYLQVINVTDRL